MDASGWVYMYKSVGLLFIFNFSIRFIFNLLTNDLASLFRSASKFASFYFVTLCKICLYLKMSTSTIPKQSMSNCLPCQHKVGQYSVIASKIFFSLTVLIHEGYAA